MGKGRINITKKGDFHFSFKGPLFFNNENGHKKRKRGQTWLWDERFLFSITAQVVHFSVHELSSTSNRINWKLDFIAYRP